MNLLYIAYSCNPNNGTEDKLGWEIPVCATLKNNVTIITKPDGQKDIETEILRRNLTNIKVIYIDIDNKYKKIFNGPLYSGRLNIWHKRVLIFLKKYLKDHRIDLIHQINPVEFRSIGNYGCFNGIPFVCGPLGGGEYMSPSLLKYCGKNIIFEMIRYILNLYYRFKYKHNNTLKNIDLLMFANEETKRFLIGNDCNLKSIVMTEIGAKEIEPLKKEENNIFSFLFAGRLVYRKGLTLLFNSISLVPEEYKFIVSIAGDGGELNKLKTIVNNNNKLKKRIYFLGNIPYSEMKKVYSKSDALLMPSLRETTGSVILEALSNGIPVITQNKYGAKNILNSKNSYLCDFSVNPEKKLAECIMNCVTNKDKVLGMREECLNTANMFLYSKKIKNL